MTEPLKPRIKEGKRGLLKEILDVTTVSTKAPSITGKESKNEKCAAESLFKPLANPIAMVIPDRDIPGVIANP